MNETTASIPMSETELINIYNVFCKIWEFEVDGKIDAYIRTLLIKDIPEADAILIENGTKNVTIKNLGESDYCGFKFGDKNHFETHLYLADFNRNSKQKMFVSVIRPIFASSKWINIVVADRRMFAMEVDPKQLGAVLNFYGSLFGACLNYNSKTISRGAKYLYREILANIFVGSVNSINAKDMRKHSDPEGYFSEEFHKKVIEYNSEIMGTMIKGKPYIPQDETNPNANKGKLNDLLTILSLLEYQQLNIKKAENVESEDYGEESDESSDSV